MPEISSLYSGVEFDENGLDKLLLESKYGNPEPLDKLCRYAYSRIYYYLFYRVKNKEDAEDLTSEVVLKMVKGLRNQHGNFLAWIYKIARNALIDYYRKMGRVQEISYEALSHTIPVDENPKEILMIDRLKEAITHLTKEQAELITLKFIQEYDNKEIAQIMGKSIGAIKVLQYRALKALREYFRKKGYEIKD